MIFFNIYSLVNAYEFQITSLKVVEVPTCRTLFVYQLICAILNYKNNYYVSAFEFKYLIFYENNFSFLNYNFYF